MISSDSASSRRFLGHWHLFWGMWAASASQPRFGRNLVTGLTSGGTLANGGHYT